MVHTYKRADNALESLCISAGSPESLLPAGALSTKISCFGPICSQKKETRALKHDILFQKLDRKCYNKQSATIILKSYYCLSDKITDILFLEAIKKYLQDHGVQTRWVLIGSKVIENNAFL